MSDHARLGVPLLSEHRPRDRADAASRLRHVEARIASLATEIAANRREYASLADSYHVFRSEQYSLHILLASPEARP